ncbi:MAG: glucosyltransferase domain-containing protein [Aliarcobacter sp.]|nr:glucosyltransferase domain-containing protein [Aliarcobacter sp.]
MKSYLKRYLLFITFVILIYYIQNIFIKPTIELNFNSNIKSELQLFYKKNEEGAYSEKYVINKEIKKGDNSFSCSIPYYKDVLRVDFSNQQYHVKINSLKLKFLFYSMPFEIEEENTYQIKNINKLNNANLELLTEDYASDPQVFFKIDSEKFEKYSMFIMYISVIILSILCTVFLNFIIFYFNKIMEIQKVLEYKLLNLQQYINSLEIDFKFVFIYFLIGFIFHIFEISNFLISVDDEYGAFRINPEAWISDGRWTAFFIEKFIFDQPTIPFVPNIVSCALMSLSFLFLLKAHNIKSDWKTYLLFPIYSAFPTLWMINEFYGNMVVVAFGFLMVSLSILIFIEIFNNDNCKLSIIKKLIFPSLIFAFAIGAYQSFLLLGIALLLGILILNISRNTTNVNIEIKQYILQSFIFIAFSSFFYFLINKIFKFIYQLDGTYVDGFINLSNIDVNRIFYSIFNEFIKVYSGSSEFYGNSIPALGILIIILFLTNLLNKKYLIITLLISLLLSNFLFYFITGGNILPSRSMVALPYIIWIIAFLSINYKNNILNIVGVIILIIFNWQMLSTLGQYAASTSIIQTNEKMIAQDIYQRMAVVNSNFKTEDIHTMNIYGYKTIKTIYPIVPTSTINSSFFDWDAGNMSRIINFMRLIGYENLKMVDKNSIGLYDDYFNEMSSYPNESSVKYINGVYLIKLGDKPDLYRR